MQPVRNNSNFEYLFKQNDIHQNIISWLKPQELLNLRRCNRSIRDQIDQIETLWQSFFREIDVGFVPAFAPTWLAFTKNHMKIMTHLKEVVRTGNYDWNVLTSFRQFPVFHADTLQNHLRRGNRVPILGNSVNIVDFGKYLFFHYLNLQDSGNDLILTGRKTFVKTTESQAIPANSTIYFHEGGLVCAQSPDGMMQYFHIKTMEPVATLFKKYPPAESAAEHHRRPRIKPRIQGECSLF